MLTRNDHCEISIAPDLVELLRLRAEGLGEKRLFSFINTSGSEELSITYRELHERAMAIAGELQSLIEPGEKVLLLFPSGLDFVAAFFGCLYAGVVAVPTSIPRRNRPSDSLQEVVRIANPAVVLSTAKHRDESKDHYSHNLEVLSRPWVAVDEVEKDRIQRWVNPSISGDQLAFLQFTSGSTGAPRGVMLTHDNLMQNSMLIQQSFGSSEENRGVIWLPLFHDMGLIGGILQPIFCGGSCSLLPPVAFVHRPLIWLEMITQNRASVSGGPDFAFELCARKISPADRAKLDLSSWEVAFTGAEPIRAKTLDLFASTFAECGFRREAFFPCYGLAESTLIISGGPRLTRPKVIDVDAHALAQDKVQEKNGSQSPPRRVVGCGELLPGQELRIVDPVTNTSCSEGDIGEIWVNGPSVALGYYKRPEDSKSTFQAYIKETGEGPFLRTGDLGFYRDQQLFVTGRLKDLIIIRGRNYYPEDIEQTIEHSHEDVYAGQCVVFSCEIEDQERVVVVQEIDPRQRNLDSDSVVLGIRRAVAESHELELHTIVLSKTGSIPRTTSGKKRRSECRKLFLSGNLPMKTSWTVESADSDVSEDTSHHPEHNGNGAKHVRTATAKEIEKWLTQNIAKRLKTSESHIKTTTPFLEIGMSSLDAVQTAADLENWLGRKLSPTAVYNHPNIVALAEWLAKSDVETETTSSTTDANSPASENQPADLLNEIQGLSEKEMEAFILDEMAKQNDI